MERAELKIRRFKLDDGDAVIDLWRRCDLIVPWNNPILDIERKLRVDPELFLVGLIEGTLVATVMGGYDGHRGWINYLAVAPGCRRKGIGTVIMHAVEERLGAIGCPKINLQIRPGNEDVVSFYEHLGYRDDRMISMGKKLSEDPAFPR